MRSLQRLLHPKSVAVIGGAEAAAVIEQCRCLGYAGDIWPVHPTRAQVGGLPAYRSVEALPAAPDAAFVGVNRRLTVELVEALAKKGAGGAVCYASGFREADGEGADLQAALVAAAGEMPVIGPNCYGLINYALGAGLWPDQQGGTRLGPEETGVAIITQSSNIAINLTMQRRGLPLAYMLTAGNQAQTGLSDLALAVLDDPRVTALGLHIEGIDSVSGLENLAQKARTAGKPVVVIKMGVSEQAQAAGLTHSASLAGNDAAAEAFFRRLGLARVHSLPGFLETLKLLHCVGPLAGSALSSMSCSGGEACLMADAVQGRRVILRDLAEPQRQALQDVLGPLVTVSQPLDYHTYIWADVPAMTAAFTAMFSGGFDLNLVVLDFPREDRCAPDLWWHTVEAVESAARTTEAKVAILATLPENLTEDQAKALMARGLVPLCGVTEALDAAEAAAAIGQAWAQSVPPPLHQIAAPASAEPVMLDEAAAKERLSRHGVAVPEGARVDCLQTAQSAAQSIGFPLALKALGLAHKTEARALRLNLQNSEDLRRAVADLRPLGRGLYLEAMVVDPVCEIIVGLTRDPQFGLLLTLGSGGILVELLDDSRSLLLPCGRHEVEEAFDGLRSAPLLEGYRGRPAADKAALLDLIMAVQDFALGAGERLLELDINPVMVCAEGQGAFAADALIVLEGTAHV